MKQDISTLMDGELFEDEAELVLNKMKKDKATHAEWETYHLIGDALRQPDHVCKKFSANFHERLSAEPTVFAPRSRVKKTVRYFALSAAASVMALALVAWLSMQVATEPVSIMASAQPQNEIRAASYSGPNGVNDYLLAHHDYSPSTGVHGAASYIHTVAEK
ncbi:MAG: sigma-E factor negative regulatory protein [Gallionellaceae bacterium]